MPFFVTPNVIAIVVLTVLLVSSFMALFRRMGGARKGDIVVLKLRENIDSVDKVLEIVHLPFVLEVAVDQLGHGPICYIAVAAKHSKRVLNELSAEEISDYELYYPGGVHMGAYLKGERALADMDISKIDFSEVNEIGEGAVVQFVFHKKVGEKFEVNIRILVSAPSSYQAKEILSRIKSSMPSVKLVEVSNTEFLTRVNSREFEPKESMTLTA